MDKINFNLAYGVLAGGKSTRMGADKAQLMLNGRTFLEAVLDAGGDLRERIVSVAEDIPIPNVTIVRDERADIGPLEGMRQILLRAEAPACLIVATDMPYLTRAFVNALAARYSGSGNLVLTNGGRNEPMCSIYCRECAPVIEELQSAGRMRPAFLFDRVPTEYVSIGELGFSPDLVRNINTAEEYISAAQNRYQTDTPCRKFVGGAWIDHRLSLADERELTIAVNGRAPERIPCSPVDIEELVIGHVTAEGYGKIISMKIEGMRAEVTAEYAQRRVKPHADWNEAQIRAMHDYIVRDADAHRGSHSTHSCTLMRNGEILFSREDVSRHCAIDRAIGRAVQLNVPLAECVAFFSGRVSQAAVRKMIGSGIPVLCGKALPTAQAASLARRCGLTLLHCSDRRGLIQF